MTVILILVLAATLFTAGALCGYHAGWEDGDQAARTAIERWQTRHTRR